MADAELLALPDTQAEHDARGIAIDAVGIGGLRYPVIIAEKGGLAPVSTVGIFDMRVRLPATAKGTHMSRFVELLHYDMRQLDMTHFQLLVLQMLDRLGATSGELTVRFPFFLEKGAPISGVRSLLDCDVTWRGGIGTDGKYWFRG